MSCRVVLSVTVGLVFSPLGPARIDADTADPPGQQERPRLVVQLGHAMGVLSVAFSADGRQVLTGSSGNTARLWDAATGEEIRKFEGHAEAVSSVALSRDGRHVLTGSADKTARLWDAATGKQLRTFEGHADGLKSVAFSPDGRHVLTGSEDKTARLWDAATGEEIRKFEPHVRVGSQ